MRRKPAKNGLMLGERLFAIPSLLQLRVDILNGLPQGPVLHVVCQQLHDLVEGELLAYQVRGYHSSKRRGSFWRPFQIRKIDAISVTEELFTPRMKEGYIKVCDLIQGTALVRVNGADAYMHFNPAIAGPPTPAYLTSTPTMLMRMIAGNPGASTQN